MQKIIAVLLFFSMTTSLALGQDLTSREVEGIAKRFIKKLQKNNKETLNIMVSDFTDGKVAPTELGRYLAEEFSFHLSDIDDDRLSILDRSSLQVLLKEQGMNRDRLIDPLSAVKLGKIKGMQYLMYGTIMDKGETYMVYVKLLKVETLEILSSVRGSITKVPSLPEHN